MSGQNTLLAKELRELTGLGAWEGGSLPWRTANRSSISCVDGTGPQQSSFRAASLASISAWVGMDSAIQNNAREEITLLLKTKGFTGFFFLKIVFLSGIRLWTPKQKPPSAPDMKGGSYCSDLENTLTLNAILFFQVLASFTVYLLAVSIRVMSFGNRLTRDTRDRQRNKCHLDSIVHCSHSS